ncbi:hypothetical protein HYX17_01980 [Candidatus Woesearchaeota archaeon]|nr:hypothetical protein [Candidatus Woesearchaeota archaeon]
MRKKETKHNSSYYSDLQKDRNLEILKLAINELKEKYNLNYSEILSLIKEEPKELEIPISAFSNKKLSTLEIICKYLKEIRNLKYHDIAILIRRDDRTIWTTYQNSLKKFSDPLVIEKSEIFIPVSVFANRNFSSLEALIVFLKEVSKLRYNEIAKLLKKDQRNIWTVYNRAIKKRGVNEKG